MGVGLAISAATAAFNAHQQGKAAEANAEYQGEMQQMYKEVAEKNAKMAIQEYGEQSAAENVALGQSQEAAAREKLQIRKERLQKMGTAMASSEAAGQALQYLMGDFYRQEANYREAVTRQYDLDKVNTGIRKGNARAVANNRGQSYQRYIGQDTPGPNLMATALQIGGSALNSYAQATDYGRVRLWGKEKQQDPLYSVGGVGGAIGR